MDQRLLVDLRIGWTENQLRGWQRSEASRGHAAKQEGSTNTEQKLDSDFNDLKYKQFYSIMLRSFPFCSSNSCSVITPCSWSSSKRSREAIGSSTGSVCWSVVFASFCALPASTSFATRFLDSAPSSTAFVQPAQLNPQKTTGWVVNCNPAI